MFADELESMRMNLSNGNNLGLAALLCSLTLVISFPLSAAAAPAQTLQPVQEDPLERATLDIAKDLRCTVCQNQPVSESNADLAKDMRQIIREQLIAGKSRAEIVEYFVARYGDYVLMKPPADRSGLLLWIAPPLLLVTLVLLSLVFLRQRSHSPPPPPAKALSKQDQARVRAARRQQD
jgi:cytochrome c-type biogenesis protein CcmH